MAKGDKFIELSNDLRKVKELEIKLYFSEIEKIIGAKLCDSAYKYSAYWHKSETHTITYSWLNEGYEVKGINMKEKYIILKKIGDEVKSIQRNESSIYINKKYTKFRDKGYYISNLGLNECKGSVEKIKRHEKFIEYLTREEIVFEESEIINEDNDEKEIVIFDKSKVKINIIKNTAEYINTIISLNDDSGRSFYRGHNSWEYRFEPSIYRDDNRKILENEHNIFKDIISTKPEFFKECNSCLEMLVKMQHHGLPTRLMDLTENPLIALFFACYSENASEEKIAEISKFNIKETHFKYYDSDTVSVLSNLAKQSVDFDIRGFNKVDINLEENVKKLLHDIKEEKNYFKEEIKKEHLENYTVVVKAKSSIERITNQSGVFVLFGMKGNKGTCSDLNIVNNKDKLDVILIPKNKKKKILDELNLLNINRLTVFGDFDNVAKYFKSKYNQKI